MSLNWSITGKNRTSWTALLLLCYQQENLVTDFTTLLRTSHLCAHGFNVHRKSYITDNETSFVKTSEEK